ncbi:ATP-binding protein [Dactylosporangium sp. NBC_01737]|uniref:HAMP domain-containing sensor histidine kinase n=1 Tax=Dactylosporangium sp. NBC_01737 TaxID=2975959 RepID=UPI002E0FBB0A|nr:ATP-binding protein [Dactylosporangium sp. NBC_01737]
MSFRIRVFALVLLIAVTAIGLTAWLSVRLTAGQFAESQQTATRNELSTVDTFRTYALRHGTWAGIDKVVQRLSSTNQQRIRLTNLYGQVTVDTDHLANRAARPVITSPALIDPRPTLVFPPAELAAQASPGVEAKVGNRLEAVTLQNIVEYRQTVLFARCLTDLFATPPTLTTNRYGIPVGNGKTDDLGCGEQVREAVAVDAEGDMSYVVTCRGEKDTASCLTKAFGERVASFAPEPLQLFLGAREDDAVTLIGRPGLIAGGGVLFLVILGTAIIARHVSRPVRDLTAASRRLADGDLDARVTSVGRDELGQLSESFNRMAAAVQAAEQAQRRLVASVAHELRTPLSNLLGYLEALQDGLVAPRRELFASLHDEAVLQRRILDDLQDLTLAEAGHLTYRRSDFDVADLVDTARVAHLAVAEAAGVRLTAATAGPLPVHADHDRLRQVLGNLIGNAIRYTDRGGEVTLRAFPDGDRVAVEVRDTGCGIAPADLPFVFQRFWRADPARDRATGGSGLGLTIARQIVRDHDGDLAVQSVVGEGSTFRFTLPH